MMPHVAMPLRSRLGFLRERSCSALELLRHTSLPQNIAIA
jgi:hypothetical protein